MKKFEVTLKWLTPKLLVVVELEGKSADDVLTKVRKDAPFPFRDASFLSISLVE